ncbi:MAG: hypothetical protein J6S54_12805 [Lentisphaeria bacterium]|nr:hypothetical protein [Lentisphaeria bacterium]
MADTICPFCRSSNITSSRRGFSITQAILGECVFGPAGALAGAIDQDKITVKCHTCGKSWEDGTIPVPPQAPQRTISYEELRLQNESARLERELWNCEHQDLREEIKEGNDRTFIDKQIKERKFKIAGKKFVEAAALAFAEMTVRISCARKKNNMDAGELFLSFDEIAGKELLDAFDSILAELGKSSHFTFFRQEAVHFAVSINYPIYAVKEMTEKTKELLAAEAETLSLKTYRFKCPECGQKYEGYQSHIGTLTDCVTCSKKISLIPIDFMKK